MGAMYFRVLCRNSCWKTEKNIKPLGQNNRPLAQNGARNISETKQEELCGCIRGSSANYMVQSLSWEVDSSADGQDVSWFQ
jgi:hypothetical protein